MTDATTSTVLLYAARGRELTPVPVPEGVRDVHAAFDGLPGGAYEALRTYGHGRFLGLEEHLARLRGSCAALGIEGAYDEQDLRAALQRAADGSPFPDARIRFDVLAEPAPERLGCDARVVLALAPVPAPDPTLLEQGVEVLLERELARTDPEVKDAAWVVRRRPRPQGTREAFEHLLVDPEGRLLEGTSSNLFCVRNHVLYTAPDGVLRGVTRKLVLDLAREQLLSVRMVAIREDELDSLDEAFLTSSSRHLVPVVAIDGRPVGDGRPGPLTLRLAAAYEQMVERRARPAHTP